MKAESTITITYPNGTVVEFTKDEALALFFSLEKALNLDMRPIVWPQTTPTFPPEDQWPWRHYVTCSTTPEWAEGLRCSGTVEFPSEKIQYEDGRILPKDQP